MIEILVVIAILVTIMSLTVAAIPALRRMSMVNHTSGILAMLQAGLSAGGAESAQNTATVEHPLLGSVAPRRPFVRSPGSTLPDPQAAGEGLRVSDPEWIGVGHQGRILLGDDRCADPDLPQFFGLERRELSVIGSSLPWITRYRQLPEPRSSTSLPPGGDGYGPELYPDERHLISPRAGTWFDDFIWTPISDPADDAVDDLLDRALIAAIPSGLDELITMKAIYRPDPARDPLIANHRVREDRSPGVETVASSWSPGRLLASDDGGGWRRYRLRGGAVVDAWGNEVLVMSEPGGGLRCLSAGPDGSFRWLPGEDGIFQTLADTDDIAGDDRDASRDNISLGGGRR